MTTADPSLPSTSNSLSRVRRGTVLLVLGRLWGSACTFLALWLLADQLSGDDFGRYTFYLAAFMLLDSFVDFGTGAIAVQRAADDEREIPEVLAATRRIRAVAGLLGVLIVGGGAFLANEPGAGWILLASLYPVTHVLELSATIFRTRIAWKTPVAVRAFSSAASLAFVLLLIARGATEPGLYLCAVAAGSASANILLHFVSRPHLPGGHARHIPWRSVLVASVPLGLAGLCQQTYFYVDNLFLRALVGREELGHYNVGVRMMSLSIMVGVYAALVALPWLRREFTAQRLGPAIARLAQPLFAIAAFSTGALAPWSEHWLAIFGPEFSEAAPSLQWLFGASALVYVGAPSLTALVAIGNSGAVLRVALLGLFLNVVGNTLLIPQLGSQGAAIATFATEGGVVLGAFWCLQRAGVSQLGGAKPWRWALGPFLFGVGWVLSAALPLSSIFTSF
ncbi:MAG: O-antigen/teichoic acid export membrane protein [Candidatus Paceibacteria bacterium]